ncbi:hypothetical protein ABIE44_000834 [Marmoricola sp. OAE513]|uniref:hypothetical protein n=1 Tax=Marmoricola sp. OAE513 TaxID=2817894 RepID=UPI001AE898F2
MITYYATSPHGYTFRKFVDSWAPELAEQSRVVGYSEIDLASPPAPGLHVLTDFERLLPPERAFVRRLHRRLQGAGRRVIGDPGRWLGRHALLERLHAEGINDFRAYTVDELGPHVRFPVFLRWANAHDGSLGEPVLDQTELEARLARIARDHHRRWRWIRDQLLVVEKVDARSPDGLFRKYSIARIGSEFVPRHVEVSGNWVTKYPSVVTPATVAEEEAFLAEPQDLDLVRRVFDLAGIEFGRIDWGYADGRAQIWEINTNPMLAPGGVPHELREPSQRRLAGLTAQALLSQVPAADVAARGKLVPAYERWVWNGVNRGSRRWDPRRR